MDDMILNEEIITIIYFIFTKGVQFAGMYRTEENHSFNSGTTDNFIKTS